MTHLRRLLPLAAILAVLWAQAFGIQRGYFCDADGGHYTWADHCHLGDAHAQDHDDSEDHDDRHEHESVIDDLVARALSSAKIQPPAPSFCVIEPAISEFSGLIAALPHLAPPDLPRSETSHRAHDDWPSQIARTISLRL